MTELILIAVLALASVISGLHSVRVSKKKSLNQIVDCLISTSTVKVDLPSEPSAR